MKLWERMRARIAAIRAAWRLRRATRRAAKQARRKLNVEAKALREAND